MGEHRGKPPRPADPNALAKLRGEWGSQPPRHMDQIGCEMGVKILPQKNVIILPTGVNAIERDGAKYVTAPTGEEVMLPSDALIFHEGQQLDESLLDVVLFAEANYIKGTSVLVAGGKRPMVKVALAELGRIPLAEFKKRVDEVLAGVERQQAS